MEQVLQNTVSYGNTNHHYQVSLTEFKLWIAKLSVLRKLSVAELNIYSKRVLLSFKLLNIVVLNFNVTYCRYKANSGKQSCEQFQNPQSNKILVESWESLGWWRNSSPVTEPVHRILPLDPVQRQLNTVQTIKHSLKIYLSLFFFLAR
jgi:hypothetical protein